MANDSQNTSDTVQSSYNAEFSALAAELAQLVDSTSFSNEISNYELLRSNIVQRAFSTTEIDNTNGFGVNAVIEMIESIILPSIFSKDRGWKELPDIGDSTMNGVSVGLFRQLFSNVFFGSAAINVGLLAAEINEFDWQESAELTRELMFNLLANEKVSALFYYAFISQPLLRYPIIIMTSEPAVGFLLAQWGFETMPQNDTFYFSLELDSLLAEVGLVEPDFDTTTIGLYSYSLLWTSEEARQKLAEGVGADFVIKALKRREDWIMSTTSPVETNELGKFQTSWRERLYVGPDSNLGIIVKINEQFVLNPNNRPAIG